MKKIAKKSKLQANDVQQSKGGLVAKTRIRVGAAKKG